MAKRGGQVRKKTKRVNRTRPRKSPPPKPRKKPAPKPRKKPRKGPTPKSPPRKPRKRLNLPSWADSPVLGPFDRPLAQEAEFASAYCRKWLRVHDWALDNVIGDVKLFNGDPRRRIAEGLVVLDPQDSEEAYERGIPLEQLLNTIDDTIGKDEGGIRRVVIRLLTWALDTEQGSVYEPRWGQFASGMTAREAVHKLNRYIRNYIYAVSKHLESRKLIVTGMSIVWWTSADKELNYV